MSVISSTEKLLDVLLLFRHHNGDITIDDITIALDIPRSTAYRYTKTLTDKGFLDKGATPGGYRLGHVFLEMTQTVLASSRELHLAAMPNMMALASATRESVSLMRLLSRRAVCIESIEGAYALRVSIQRGRSQPLHAGASSRVLLAHQPEATWESYLDFPLAGYTANTYTTPAALYESLRRVQKQGYAVSDGEIDIGARAVAVPIFSLNGDALAALSIEAPASRMTDEVLAVYLPRLTEAAQAIEAALTSI